MYLLLGILSVACGMGLLKMRLFPSYKAHWVTSIPIAHRGFFDHKKGIPENSLSAFRQAMEKGYAIELDVMLSKDGYVVVHHDSDLNRLSGVNKRVDALTVPQLQSYMLLDTDERLPTLQEVLDCVQDRVPLYIEIKHERYSPAGKLEQQVAALLDGYKGRVAILSFNPQSLEWFAKNAPHYCRGQSYHLVYGNKDDILQAFSIFQNLKILIDIVHKMWIARPHFITYNHALTPKCLLDIFSSACDLIAYNVMSQEDYEEATQYARNVIFEKIDL